MKFEGSGSKGTRVIERKRSVTDGQMMDRQPDGQTDKAKTICLPQRGGDIIKNNVGITYRVHVIVKELSHTGHHIKCYGLQQSHHLYVPT